MTYNQTLPNFRNILSNIWSLLKISNRLKHVFQEQPITAYRRNKNLRNMMGDTTIENNKVVRKQKPVLKNGYCKSCFSKRNKPFCKQVAPDHNF